MLILELILNDMYYLLVVNGNVRHYERYTTELIVLLNSHFIFKQLKIIKNNNN